MFVCMCVCLSIVLVVCSAVSHHVWLVVAELLDVVMVIDCEDCHGEL